ncbi:unnamed protein product [Acanthosepion pharaonis]|uniref:Uncharacterized protein n=1 Tax=Acanthosepion pharaonis TaxID=158019 RepID=A0A812CX17_ACAPH|nr:unnamed protein product [Sepia pharaonis]
MAPVSSNCQACFYSAHHSDSEALAKHAGAPDTHAIRSPRRTYPLFRMHIHIFLFLPILISFFPLSPLSLYLSIYLSIYPSLSNLFLFFYLFLPHCLSLSLFFIPFHQSFSHYIYLSFSLSFLLRCLSIYSLFFTSVSSIFPPYLPFNITLFPSFSFILFLPLSLSLSLSLSLCHYQSSFPSFYIPVILSIYLSLFSSRIHLFSIVFHPFLSASSFLSLSPCFFLSLSVSFTLSLSSPFHSSVCHCLYSFTLLPPTFYLSLSLSFSLAFILCPFLSYSINSFFSFCHSPLLSFSHFLSLRSLLKDLLHHFSVLLSSSSSSFFFFSIILRPIY